MQPQIAVYDVFADRPFCGNQAAVVHEGERRLSDRQLLVLAAELRLAETALSSIRGPDLTFRFANEDRVLNRCGHASLAGVADHVFSRILKHRPRHGKWDGRYRVGSVVAEWRAWTAQSHGGRSSGGFGLDVAIAWPDRPQRIKSLSAQSVYQAFGLKPADGAGLPLAVYNSGNLNALVPVRTVGLLQRAKPDWAKLKTLFHKHRLTDVHLYYLLGHDRSESQLRLRCRNLFPYGLFEEPATGTASVSLAALLVDRLATLRMGDHGITFLFDQGSGRRRGKICVNWCPKPGGDPTIWLKGRVFPVMRGHLISTPSG